MTNKVQVKDKFNLEFEINDQHILIRRQEIHLKEYTFNTESISKLYLQKRNGNIFTLMLSKLGLRKTLFGNRYKTDRVTVVLKDTNGYNHIVHFNNLKIRKIAPAIKEVNSIIKNLRSAPNVSRL